MDPYELLRSTLTCTQLLAATLLFASRLPMRKPLAGRIATVALFFCAWSVLLASIMPSIMPGSGSGGAIVITYAIALAAMLGFVVFLFEASPWTALFCCTAGYTTQNLASGLSSLVGNLAFPQGMGIGVQIVQMTVPYAVVYLAVHAVLVSRIRRNGLELIQQRVMLPMMAVVILAVIGFDVVIKEMWVSGIDPEIAVVCRLVHLLLCVLVLAFEYEALYSRRMGEEVATIERIMEDEKAQYQLSRDTIESINIKCHDIKHQIRELGSGLAVDPKAIDEIAQKVSIYDAAVRTGNEPLDVILTEKSLACEREGITMSCIADGAALGRLDASDIYSLMGNALDNAIEAARGVRDPSKRSISLVIRRRASMTVIHVENYFEGTVVLDAAGIAKTTKKDPAAHGYGMKSMRLIAERYGGTLHARTQGDVFHLNVMLPAPAEA